MSTHPDREKQLGEDIAFGVQQTFACWATDFIDPFVGKWFQDRFKDDRHQGTLAHNWGGEIVGDTAALVIFLALCKYFRQPVEWIEHSMVAAGGSLYDRVGKKSLKGWAEKHQLDEHSERYQMKLEEWKYFQAENFAKSLIIAASSTVVNVAVQKAMGNTHKLAVITGGKVVGAAVTMGVMLGLRMVVPHTTKELDEELSERYFMPVIRRVQGVMGAKIEKPAHSHADRVRKAIPGKDISSALVAR